VFTAILTTVGFKDIHGYFRTHNFPDEQPHAWPYLFLEQVTQEGYSFLADENLLNTKFTLTSKGSVVLPVTRTSKS